MTRALFVFPLIIFYLIPTYSYSFVISGDELSDVQHACSILHPKLVIGVDTYENNGDTCIVNDNGCPVETYVYNVEVHGDKVFIKTDVGNIEVKLTPPGVLVIYSTYSKRVTNIYVFMNNRIYYVTPNYVELINTNGDVIKKYKNPYLNFDYYISYYEYQLDNSECYLTLYAYNPSPPGQDKLIKITISNDNVKFYVANLNEFPARGVELYRFFNTIQVTQFAVFHGIDGYEFILHDYIPFKGYNFMDNTVSFGFSQLLTRVLLAMIIKFLISDNNVVSLAKYLPFNIVVYTYVPGFNKLISESYPKLLLDCAIAALLDLTTKIIAIYYVKTISSITKIFGDILGLLANNIPFMGIFNILSTIILKPILNTLGIPCYEFSVSNVTSIAYITSNCEEVAIRVQKECYDVPVYYSAVTFAIGETLSRILIGYVKVTSLRDVFDNLADKIFHFSIYSILPYPIAVECHFFVDSSGPIPHVVYFYSDHPVLDYIIDNLYLLLHGYVSLPEIIDLTWLTIECHLIKLLTGVDLLWPYLNVALQ